MPRRMHLVGYLMAGPTWHLYGSWRHPEHDGRHALDVARYEAIARTLERGCFDGLFFVDFLMLFDTFADGFDTNLREAGQMCLLEPMQLLAAMARVTRRIGLSATMSTTLYPPFHIARAFATLDHLSGGRAGWNVVTSATAAEAQNFGFDQLPDKGTRYDRADEVMAACDALWSSWQPDALQADAAANRFIDPAKVAYANYQGRFLRTRGPLTTPRPPQGRPVIMQAGSSDRGREFAARWAEIIFTVQSEKSAMQEFHADIKRRMSSYARAPQECAVLPAIDVVVAETSSEAVERAEQINAWANPTLGLAELSGVLGRDLSSVAPDLPIASLDLGSAYQGLIDILRRVAGPDMTVTQAGRAWAQNQMLPQLVGTAAEIADQLEDYVRTECCDGFMVCPSLSPGGFTRFVDLVVPELQRRGLFRTCYEADTFRGHLHDG